MANKKRSFDGKTYILSRTSKKKKDATNHANDLRDDGNFARITKLDAGGYQTWKRRTPLSKVGGKRR